MTGGVGTGGILGGPLSADPAAPLPLHHHHGHPTPGSGHVEDPAARMAMLMSQRNAMARARIVGQDGAGGPPSPVFRNNAMGP